MDIILKKLESMEAGAVLALFIAISIIAIVNYIFLAIGLFNSGKKIDKKGSWMAWVPYLNYYYIAKMSVNNIYGTVMLVALAFASIFQNLIMIIITYLAFLIMLINAYVKYFNLFAGKKEGHKYITIFTLGLMGPLCVFLIKDKKKK